MTGRIYLDSWILSPQGATTSVANLSTGKHMKRHSTGYSCRIVDDFLQILIY